MINVIRADFYRLLHKRVFFITQIALILIIIVSVSTQALGSAGVMTEQLKHLQSGALDLKVGQLPNSHCYEHNGRLSHLLLFTAVCDDFRL